MNSSRPLLVSNPGSFILIFALTSLSGCEIATSDAYKAPTPSLVETVLSRRSGALLQVYHDTSQTTIRTGETAQMRSLLGKLDAALTPCAVLPAFDTDDEPIADILVQTGKDPFQFFVIGYRDGEVLYRLERTYFIGGREAKMVEFLSSAAGSDSRLDDM